MTIGTAILLPGLDGTGDLFAPFVNTAPPEVDTIVVQYPIREASIDALEQHARAKLANPCIVIAESFSGPIGLRLAADARVRALVLCNSFITGPLPSFFHYLARAPLLAVPIPRFALRHLLLGSQASQGLVELTRRTIARLPAEVMAHRLRQVLRTDARAEVRALTKPL